MNGKDFFFRIVNSYFMITTFITIAILAFGLYYEPNTSFGYDAFFSPLVFGFAGVIPSIVMYSRKELSIRQILIRKIIQIITIEVIILSMALFSPMIHVENPVIAVEFAGSVFIIFLIANGISYIQNKVTAVKLTDELIRLQNQENNKL